jgi:signal transduction histidine kinase
MRYLGFASAACYRWRGSTLTQVLCWAPSAEVAWPSAVDLAQPKNYTPAPARMGKARGAPSQVPANQEPPELGWGRPLASVSGRSSWPKGANLYFPEQELADDKVVFAVTSAVGKRVRAGELSGALEAAAARIRGWFADQERRHELAEAGLAERLKTLGADLQMLVDHELRTPLASVTGYAALLHDVDPKTQPEVWNEYWRVIDVEVENALAAVDKLSLALAEGGGWDDGAVRFDAAAETRLLADEVQARVGELVSEDAARRVSIRFLKATDSECALVASKKLYRWALWEVLKNAVIHARGGSVEVSVYASDRSLVVDVSDDGAGVSPGAEELIFLRFYQDPNTQHLRRGKRGLGLGLFLARHIAERHLGQLTFMRQKGKSTFRFVWPLAADGEGELERGA